MAIATTLVPFSRHTQRMTRPRDCAKSRKQFVGKPELHELVLTSMTSVNNNKGPIPRNVTLVSPDANNPSLDALYIDYAPVPKKAWHYNRHDRVLSWQGAYGGGHLHINEFGRGATGIIGEATQAVSVQGSAKAQFMCSVAKNVGASYVSSGSKIVGMQWDTDSNEWKAANWKQSQNRLLLSYTVSQSSPIQPPEFTFEFDDKQTDAAPWEPALGTFVATLQLGNQKGSMAWDLNFRSNIPPLPDIGSHPAQGPDTVYPYWLEAVEDAAAASINGVLEIDNMSPNGELIGFQGERTHATTAGYYRTTAKHAPFALFEGKMHLNGKPVCRSHIQQNTLHWCGLPADLQQKLGLPGQGKIQFNHSGCTGVINQNNLPVNRLSTTELSSALEKHRAVHPTVSGMAHDHLLAFAASDLNMTGLMAMSPYTQDNDGKLNDVVQESVRNDLSDIMNSFVPNKVWSLLFGSSPQPTLSGTLAEVANSPVKGITDPGTWYASLSTAVLTQGMANGSDQYCANMNGPRAAVWLKQQVTNSIVYQTHSQVLFQNQWHSRFPLTQRYLDDQSLNGATYKPIIVQTVNQQVADIQGNVAVDSDSPDDLKEKLVQQVSEAGQYAQDKGLYWAFAFYTYNTAPGILANISAQMSINSGSSDGSYLSRLFQQNIAVMTALDPSGYFAREYNKTINTFMATNILPSMYGFNDDPATFSLMREYLQAFVNQNIANQDAQIANTAKQIQAILAEENSDEFIKSSIDALRSFSEAIDDTLALPYVATLFDNWIENTTWGARAGKAASVFGGLIVSGLTSLGIFALVMEYKSWDKLNSGQRAELIAATVQLGLQVVSAMVKRGVQMSAVFSVDGLSFGQRMGAIGKLMLGTESDMVNDGLMNIGNRFARWLGDTNGSMEMEAEATMAQIGLFGEAEEVSFAIKVFGRNLDEFIATRLGPVMILAGIGLSIYFLSTGEAGVALASDVINIVGGALSLTALIGGWAVSTAVEAGTLAADSLIVSIVGAAGPLAIILALVGIGLMLYEMFKKQPDPVEEFVNDYVKPAGFYVASKCSAIDYAMPYKNSSNNLLLMGLSLGSGEKNLEALTDGQIQLGNDSGKTPASVWQATTDGLGQSQFVTVIPQDSPNATGTGKSRLIPVLLTLMSDNSISFQPKMRKNIDTESTVKPITQTWLTHPLGNATTVNHNSNLNTLQLSIQPVMADTKGQFSPANAKGYLVATTTGLAYSDGAPTSFTLSMQGMSPNYMQMNDLNFLLNTIPSPQESFGPGFARAPSTPLTFQLTPQVPDFLTFDTQTGVIKPNGQKATAASQTSMTLTASNSLGRTKTQFELTIAASSTNAF